jgi:hypothetical protein
MLFFFERFCACSKTSVGFVPFPAMIKWVTSHQEDLPQTHCSLIVAGEEGGALRQRVYTFGPSGLFQAFGEDKPIRQKSVY